MAVLPNSRVVAVMTSLTAFVPLGLAAAQGGKLDAPMVREFLAGGLGAPRPGVPDEVRQFGQLTGVWEARQEMRSRDGSWVNVGTGIWIWKYALGGVAVQDLWFQPKAELPSYLGPLDHDYALTALRIWDSRASRWRIAWAANGLGVTPGDDFGTAEAVLSGDRIVMSSPGTGGGDQRITFHSIATNSFEWVSEFSTDGGKTWQDVMRVHAVRIR